MSATRTLGRSIARKQSPRLKDRKLAPAELQELARIAVALARVGLDDDTREALETRALAIRAIPVLGRAEIAAATRRAHASL